MQYELRVWNDQEKLQRPEPIKFGQGFWHDLGDYTSVHLTSPIEHKHDYMKRIGAKTPDILIDTNGGGGQVITSADVEFHTEKIKGSDQKVPCVRITLKGDLYLPLDISADGAAKAIGLGTEGDENKLRNPILLSDWAMLQPPDEANALNDPNKTFYRAINFSTLNKFGEFRLIIANNVYVESYDEDYSEGEFGTFELVLNQRAVDDKILEIDGLKSEKMTALDKVVKKLGSAVDGIKKAYNTNTVQVNKNLAEDVLPTFYYADIAAGNENPILVVADKIGFHDFIEYKNSHKDDPENNTPADSTSNSTDSKDTAADSKDTAADSSSVDKPNVIANLRNGNLSDLLSKAADKRLTDKAKDDKE